MLSFRLQLPNGSARNLTSVQLQSDSGGIQEETTVLGKPCLTVRPNTERPITILQGTNKLIQIQDIESEVANILAGRGKTGQVPPLWDGKSAGRIVDHLTKILA